MPAYTLTGTHEALLCRLSNKFTEVSGKKVSKREVLRKILDEVIEEEELLSIKEEQPRSFFKRIIVFQQPNPNNKEKMTKSSQDIIKRLKFMSK